MVFDEWQNGIPITFIIIGHGKEEDITSSLQRFNKRLFKHAPNWYPNAIIFYNAQVELNAIKYYINSLFIRHYVHLI